MTLASEVVAIGMAAAAPIGTGVRHLIPEEAMVAGNSAPARCRDRAEMMGCFALSGEVVVPRAVRAALSLLEFLRGQCVVCGVLAVPRDSAACPSSQPGIGPGYYVGLVWHGIAPVLSVSPCQFPSFFIFFHQPQKSFSCVGSDEPLADHLGSADVGELMDAELGPPLLCVGL
jgi:hypothetical protein